MRPKHRRDAAERGARGDTSPMKKTGSIAINALELPLRNTELACREPRFAKRKTAECAEGFWL